MRLSARFKMPDAPHDPFSSMAAASVQLHEQFQSLVSAGFTPSEAMTIVTSMIRELLRHALDNQ